MLANFSSSDFATQFYQTYYLQLIQVRPTVVVVVVVVVVCFPL